MAAANTSAHYPSLEGKPVFITGGATGIGAAIVRGFVRNRARVMFVDVDEAAGLALAEETGAEFAVQDVTDVPGLQACVNRLAETCGGLGVLVNNVANDVRHEVSEVTYDTWRGNLSVNLDPVFFASQAALPHLKAAGGGAIVNLSSLQALVADANLPAYVAAKSAILGLTKSLARAAGPDRIRVNAVVPGWVLTEKQRRLWLTEEAHAGWRAACALKEDIQADDVANLVLFLASDDSRMITGQSVVIDSGRT
ncbi:MAG: SDR family oxidoreductase [Hyphomonas sp.]|uniref:SDR family NAD(P)-dependent oxidoreductase n=1 Tax=Hyphomonas sp. TaxID=87 RepID=UPI003527D0E4